MNHLNSILLEGNVVRPPEAKTTGGPSGQPLVVFRIASNRYYRTPQTKPGAWEEGTLYMDVLAWGQLGLKCMECLDKGMLVRAIGRLRSSSFVKEGEERPTVRFSIIAQHIEFRRRRPEGGDEEEVTLNASMEDEGGALGEPLVVYEY